MLPRIPAMPASPLLMEQRCIPGTVALPLPLITAPVSFIVGAKVGLFESDIAAIDAEAATLLPPRLGEDRALQAIVDWRSESSPLATVWPLS